VPENVLGPQQRLLLQGLREWAAAVHAEANLRSLGEAFGGWHDGTLASVVLRCTSYDERRAAPGDHALQQVFTEGSLVSSGCEFLKQSLLFILM